MELTEFLKAKLVMEYELLSEITKIVQKFKQATGYTPHSIRICMSETTTIEKKLKEYRIISVNAGVEL